MAYTARHSSHFALDGAVCATAWPSSHFALDGAACATLIRSQGLRNK
jgi:hypothetical protein